MEDLITVPVVEDEFLVRLEIADHLEEGGFRVLEARDADEAIKLLEADFNIRLISTDVDMPRVNGWPSAGRDSRGLLEASQDHHHIRAPDCPNHRHSERKCILRQTVPWGSGALQ